MKFKNNIHILFLTLLVIATGCTNGLSVLDEEREDSPQPLVVIADIAGSVKTTSRAAQGTDDVWSYTGFENEDIMGFFSSAGKFPEGGGFDNVALQYNADLKQFSDANNGAAFSPTEMSGSQIYMYYPYSEDIYGEDIETTTGFELRRTGDSSGDTLRCVDFLSSYKIQVDGVLDGKRMALFGEFDHAFSELIIMRGEGFDNPPADKRRITAVLDNPITHLRVKIDTENGWTVIPELIYNENNSDNLNRDQSYRWDAWWGENYGKTVQDPIGKPAWYIIVPTIGSEVGKKRPGERSVVQYIELFDNEGNLQQVTGLRLSGGMTKYVDAGWRYPMEISMKEMVPTVNPYTIEPWNNDVNLTDQRTRGINNMFEFEDWVREYNAYIADQTNANEHKNALLKYGDLYVDADMNNLWHFYLLTDLDMNQYNPANSGEGNATPSNVILPVLKDVLDGEGTTLVNGKHLNCKITGLTQTFVNELQSSNGKIINIDFDEPDVRINTVDPIGIIANSVSEGTIDNCNISQGTLVNLDGPAGFVAGTLADGTITNCTLDGFMTSKETGLGDYAKIVGKNPTGNFTFSGNNATTVVTQQLQ